MKDNRFCPPFIHDILNQCKRHPQRTCCINADGKEYTYGEFYELIKKTSGYISGAGIRQKSFIVVNLPNSMEYMAVEYGAWLSGCAVVPVNPQYPQARIDYIVKHCDAALTVDEKTLEDIRGAEPVEMNNLQDDIAALFYTSGSTGTPKGVVHTFESLQARNEHWDEIYRVSGNDRFAMNSPMAFIASQFMVPYMRAGASVIFFDRETVSDIRLLQAKLEEKKVTCTFLPPSLLSQLDLSGNSCLKAVFVGSERVSNIVPQADYKLICMYGMTETCAPALFFEIDKAYDNTPIGKPVTGVEMHLADDDEICLRGLFSPGYYKDPEKSASMWRGGWFHTGDIARLLPDGNCLFVNRKDWMCKINGQRVETGEVAFAIRQVEGVMDAAVKAFTGRDGKSYLVAYYTGAQTETEEIRETLSRTLPGYMIPSYFVRIPALPLNDNGKVNISALQSPADMMSSEERKVKEPENEMQKVICKAFETVLGYAPIGIDDDFFSMGGDSIRVLQLQRQCESIGLSASAVYRFRTPELISAELAKTSVEQKTRVDADRCPLSQTQTGIFVECMSRRGEAAYNNAFLYRLGASVDLEKLARACCKALLAHPNLWAKIEVDDDGIAHQRMRDTSDFSLKVEEMTEEQFASERRSLVRPFDLLEDKLFRIRIIKTESAGYLFVDFHHIVFDGTSNGIIFNDIEKGYRGGEIASESYTGFDVALDEQELRSTPMLEECKEWNLNAFSAIDQTSLPVPDRTSGDDPGFDRFETLTSISADEFAKASDRLGVTENVISLAAFGYMLGACNHGTEAAFATVYNGRKEIRTGSTVSMMVKTLPVSFKWDASTTVQALLTSVKDQLMGSMGHDLYSFAEICSQTAFDSRVIFTYQDELLERNSLCGDKCELVPLMENATGEPLAVQLYKSSDKLVIRTEYRSDMFSRRYMEQHISCFVNILNSLLLSEKHALSSSLRLVSEYQEEELMAVNRGPELNFDRSGTIVDMFRANVAKYPEYTAVTNGESRYTYAQLDRKSEMLATRLIEEGIGLEDFVAVIMPRSVDFPVCFMACFKCGAAYVPMDYEYPMDRICYMMEDSQARVLLTTRAIYETKCQEGRFADAKVIFVDELPDGEAVPGTINKARPDSLAYMIYTSGTTGRPKGVMIEHHGLLNLVHWGATLCDIKAGTRIAEHSSFSFDGSILDLMAPLAYGGELHILPTDLRKDLNGMYRYLLDNKIEGILLTTQLGMTMLKMYDLKLRFMMLGGEKLSGKFRTSVMLINGYGPTEFTVCSSYHLVDTQNTPDNIPIGRAVPNTVSAVVDPLGRLLPYGIAGELALAGAQLARGYWHREDITAQRFVDCPFIPGEKMYKTGDLVRWNEGGELLYMGRIDTQVKLRGFRIELGEIESTMAKFEGVRTAVAAVKEISGTQHLIGYFCSEHEIDKEALRAFLSESLTEYMVPTAFVQMDSMPMTPNGKVDMRKLPIPEIKADEIVAPEGELEQRLFEITAEALGNTGFGVTSNLISMGMTSLGAISLSLQIEKKTGLRIPSSKMLEQPVIRAWAALGSTEARPDEEVMPFPVQDTYTVTDNQLGVYIDWENHRGGLQYNVPMVLQFRGVKPDTVVDAVKAFIQAHPGIKTVFTNESGNNVRQRRCDDAQIEVGCTVLDREPDEGFFQKLVRPFDLYIGPLCRFEVFSFGEMTYLMSDIHHIIFDGGSESILMSDIIGYINGKAPLTEKFTSFDYSLYLEQWKASPDFAKAETYFKSLLDGTTSVALPSSGNEAQDGLGRIACSVNRDAVRDICRKAGVTENAFFLTAVTQCLHRITREKDINILTVSNGRSLSALEHTAGMFVQTLPVVSHSSVRTVEESLQAMHRQTVETVARDKYPFTMLVEKNGLKANIIVAYQGDVISNDMTAAGYPVTVTPLAGDTAKMPVSVNITPGEKQTELAFEYDRSMFTADDIRIFADAVTAFSDNMMAAQLSDAISTMACVDADAASSLISVGSGEKMDIDVHDTLVTMFSRQLSSGPDRRAVIDEQSAISYAQLDRMSDALAAELVKRGVTKDTFVALMLPRRKEYVISYMAVFKSGGAYVPMDHEYPLDRLQYMLEDSKSQVLITDRCLYEEKAGEGGLKFDNIIFTDEFDFDAPAAHIDRSLPDGIAYMIYTSGTTGLPKGVMIEHHCVVNLVTWFAKLTGVVPGTRIAEHASFSFDASIIDLMVSLTHGAELHILGESIRKDPEAVYKYYKNNDIEGTVLSTQFGLIMLNSYDLKLRYLMMGGEKLSGKSFGSVRVFNGYGPTEFTVSSSYYALEPGRSVPDNIPIGRAVPNTVSAVIDPCGQLLPYGASGELALLGPQLARGYWNKPDITAARFVDCPFIPGQKMYRTGDLVRWNEDGELLFMGRIDTQVKLRGFRIELGEIESDISKFPGITASVAQVREINGVKHLCAYFTASSKIDVSQLKKSISETLTSYMVPDVLMQLDEMPLTPNGKVNVKLLPVPELSGHTSDDFEAPEGEVETAIASAFNEVLGLNGPYSRNYSFFMMGGNSLQVMKVIVRLSETGLSVTYGDIFKYPTPRTLAAFLDGVETGRGSAVHIEDGVPEDEEEVKVIGDDGYDYTDVNGALSDNRINAIGEISALEDHEEGDVLLLGATGFLGIHVMHELLEHGKGKIYCLIRPKADMTAEGRLKLYLMYYFDNTYSSLFGERIFIIEGDLTDDGVLEKLADVHVRTVINCAANVKHFAAGDEIEKINLRGAENMIEFCLKHDSRLIHTSTHSISGMMEECAPHTMTEDELYIGQKLMTKYQQSKFMAERSILEAVARNGLKAKIMRLGNLMPRYSDGEFQINLENNGFMARMRAYYLIGCIASSHLHNALEFAPIDETASAILTLARTPDRFTVFHPFNNHEVFVDDIVAIMRKNGLAIKTVDDDVFSERLGEALKDDRLNPFITTLVAYGSHNNYAVNPPDLSFTVNVLNAMDWRWSVTGDRYLNDIFVKLKSLEYFNR